MADKKFTQLTAAGALTVNDLLAIAQSPFGAGSSKSITGANLASFIDATVAGSSLYYRKAGETSLLLESLQTGFHTNFYTHSTADRALLVPDKNGTVALLSDIPALGLYTFPFSGTPSDLGGIYYAAPSLVNYTATVLSTRTTTISVVPTLLGVFATPSSFPNVTSLPAGILYVHIDAQKVAGGQVYYLYAEIYKRNLVGLETLLLTTDLSPGTTSNAIQSETLCAINSAAITLLATDRIVVKVYGYSSAATPDVTLRWDNGTSSMMEFPSATVSADNFVPYTGATKAVNLGAQTLTSGHHLFTDNTYDIGASLATRPRRVYVGTEVVSPLFTGDLTGTVTGHSSLDLPLSGGTVSGDLAVTGIGAFGSAVVPGVELTVQDATNNTYLYVNNNKSPLGAAGSGGSATVILRSTTTVLYGWRFSVEGSSNRFEFQKEGGGIYAWLSPQANPNFGIGSPTISGVLMHRTADGRLMLTNKDSTDFDRLQFGGDTASFPALSRSTTFLNAVLADASGPCQLSCGKNAIDSVPADALIVKNSTAAAAGAQQFSPALRIQGFGWGTTAGTSQACDWRIFGTAVQSTVPTSALRFDFSVAGGAFSTPLSLSSSGEAIVAAGGAFCFSGRSHIKSSGDGFVTLFNDAENGFSRLHFGGVTSAFPALSRSTTFLDAVLADASGPCQISCGKNAIGVTPGDALIVKNSTAAADGAQQYSPAIRLQGFGWGTTAGTSQACDWRIYSTVTQSTVPTSIFRIDSSVAGAAFAQRFAIQTDGTFLVVSNTAMRNGANPGTYFFDLGNVQFRRGDGTSASSSIKVFGTVTGQVDLVGTTPVDSLLCTNTTAAALGAQQYSPGLLFAGLGWGTTAGTSQTVQWRVYNEITQGTVPTGLLAFSYSLAGAAFATKAYITSNGVVTGAGLQSTGSIFAASTGAFIFSTRAKTQSSADGILELMNNAGDNFTRLNFGGTTNLFPAITRSTTNLSLTLADGTGNAGLTTGALTTVACQTHKYLGINAITTLDATHYCVNATANTFDVTLPTAVSVAGRTYVIKNSGTGVVTLKANGAETIDGVASWIINQYTSLTVMSDGAGWILI